MAGARAPLDRIAMVARIRQSLLVATASLVPAAVTGAQSLIVGIPNADVTPSGAWFVTHESQFKPKVERLGWNTFQFITYGAGFGTELAVSAVNFGAPATGSRAVAVGFKSVGQWPSARARRWELKGIAGTMVPVSIEDGSAGVWAFAAGSVRVPASRTRLTAGPTYGTPQLFGQRTAGLMLGLEQPLTRGLGFVADWYTGNHDLAALIPGLQIHLPRDFVVIMGYKIPNPGAPGHALMVEVAGILMR